jgi:O-antigen/teichoic acid export membrane protein
MKEKIAKSFFWVVWSKTVVQVLSFASTVLIARWLNPSDYGVMAMVGVSSGIMAMLTEMGFRGVIVQFKELKQNELNVCFWLMVVMAGASYVVLYSSAPLIADWFGSPRFVDALRVASLSLFFAPIQFVPDSMLRKRLRFDRLSQAEIVATLLTIPIMLAMAWNGFGIWTLIIGPLASGVIYTALLLVSYPWRPGWSFNTGRIGQMLRYGFSGVGVGIGWFVYAQMDTLIVGKLIGEQALGFYSMAKQIALLPVTKISTVVNQLVFPVMAEWQDNESRLRSLFLKVLRIVACVTLPLSLGLAVVADDFVPLILGPQWLQAMPMFQVFCIFAAIHSLEVLLPPVLAARYLLAFQFRWTVALILVMPVPFIIGALWLGALGVAFAWILVYPIMILIMARKVFYELHITMAAAFKEVRPMLGAAGAMAVVMLLVLWTLPNATPLDHLLRLVVATLIGAMTYGTALFWRGGVLLHEVLEPAGWVIGRRRPILKPTEIAGDVYVVDEFLAAGLDKGKNK